MDKEVDFKECQQCHQILSKEQFYKRKDRNGEHTWTASYCKPCDIEQSKQQKKKICIITN